jgi:hypothetical protein
MIKHTSLLTFELIFILKIKLDSLLRKIYNIVHSKFAEESKLISPFFTIGLPNKSCSLHIKNLISSFAIKMLLNAIQLSSIQLLQMFNSEVNQLR